MVLRPSGSSIQDNSIESSDIKDGTIQNVDINESAGINYTKLESLSANKVVVTNENGFITTSTMSTSQLLGKADLNSPNFTGVPTAPTPQTNDTSTKIATTSFVQEAITGITAANYVPVNAGNGLSKAGNTLSIDSTITATNTSVDTAIASKVDWTLQTSGEIYVDQRYTGTTSNGTIHKPYKSIQTAITAAYQSGINDVTVIIKAGNDYTENLTINRNTLGLANTTLVHLTLTCLQNATDSTSVKINGTCTISGTLTTRVRMQNIQLSSTAGSTGTALLIQQSQGRHYFDNVAITGKVVFEGSWERWTEFRRGSMSGLELNGTPVGTASVMLGDVLVSGAVTQNAGILTINNCNRLYGVTHNAGTLSLNNCSITTSGIISSSNSGAIYLNHVNLFNGSSYTALNKSGSCPYFFSNVVKAGTETVIGTRLKFGASVDDLQYRPSSPANYGNINEMSVKSALDTLGAGLSPSDFSLKEDIEYLNEKEIIVACNLKSIVKKFKFKSDQHKKIYVGVIAQEVEEVFAKEGLNAHDYAILNRIVYFDAGEEKSYLAVNYDQILAFLITVL